MVRTTSPSLFEIWSFPVVNAESTVKFNSTGVSPSKAKSETSALMVFPKKLVIMDLLMESVVRALLSINYPGLYSFDSSVQGS